MKNNRITEYFEEVETEEEYRSHHNRNIGRYVQTEKCKADTPVGIK